MLNNSTLTRLEFQGCGDLEYLALAQGLADLVCTMMSLYERDAFSGGWEIPQCGSMFVGRAY